MARWSSAGSFARVFFAWCAICKFHLMLKLLKSYRVSALDIHSTAPDALEFGFRWCVHGESSLKILPPSFS